MNNFIQSMFQTTPCLPVAVISDAADALPLAQALLAGGINNIEITLRTDAALDAVQRIKTGLPGMTVGTGTVFTAEQVQQSHRAGASYIVSPGYSAIVYEACLHAKIPYLPGAVTPTEIETLQSKGFTFAKFFPAEASGGVAMLKALAPVFPAMKFCATGGVTLENIKDYLAQPNIVGVGLSALTPQKLADAKDWAGITALAEKVVATAKQT